MGQSWLMHESWPLRPNPHCTKCQYYAPLLPCEKNKELSGGGAHHPR